MTIKPTYEELQAQVEALRETASEAAETLGFLSHHLRGRMGEAALMDMAEKADALNEALAAAPQQHLAEIRAQAGYRGWMECVRIYCTEEHFTPHPATGMTAIKGAHQYADSIRRGEVK